MTDTRDAMWTVQQPLSWPAPPIEMSVSKLLDIEACPRRWSLRSAVYGHLWDRPGYPVRPTPAMLIGTIVHKAVEAVVRALIAEGCQSTADAKAPQVLRDIGGYSKVLQRSFESVLSDVRENPRARLDGAVEGAVRARLPELRAKTQALVARLPIRGAGAIRGAVWAGRRPLTPGTYAELELSVSGLDWRGRVDLLTLSQSSCEITDFKTGVAKESHRFQMHVYATLWRRDEEINPTSRRAEKLTLQYQSGPVVVDAPDDDHLRSLEVELRSRAAAARLSLVANPPTAVTNEDNCRHCDVKHLCDSYWKSELTGPSGGLLAEGQSVFSDAQVAVIGRHGDSSWDATVERSRGLQPGTKALLRASNDPAAALRNGRSLRIVGASITVTSADRNATAVINIGSSAETFLLP